MTNFRPAFTCLIYLQHPLWCLKYGFSQMTQIFSRQRPVSPKLSWLIHHCSRAYLWCCAWIPTIRYSGCVWFPPHCPGKYNACGCVGSLRPHLRGGWMLEKHFHTIAYLLFYPILIFFPFIVSGSKEVLFLLFDVHHRMCAIKMGAIWPPLNLPLRVPAAQNRIFQQNRVCCVAFTHIRWCQNLYSILLKYFAILFSKHCFIYFYRNPQIFSH